MAILSGLIGVLLLTALFAMVLGGIFMLIGAKLAGVKQATLGNAIFAALACSLLSFLLSGTLSIIPLFGTMSGVVISLILHVLIIKEIFNTSTGKALLTWIFNFFAQVVAVIMAMIILGTGAAVLLHG